METLIENEEMERMTELDEQYDYERSQVDELEDKYLIAKQGSDAVLADMAEAKAELEVYYAKGHEPRKLTRSEVSRKGAIDMKVLQRKFDIMDGDVDACRKDKVKVVSYKIKKDA